MTLMSTHGCLMESFRLSQSEIRENLDVHKVTMQHANVQVQIANTQPTLE
jgi:hypothetical protein